MNNLLRNTTRPVPDRWTRLSSLSGRKRVKTQSHSSKSRRAPGSSWPVAPATTTSTPIARKERRSRDTRLRLGRRSRGGDRAGAEVEAVVVRLIAGLRARRAARARGRHGVAGMAVSGPGAARARKPVVASATAACLTPSARRRASSILDGSTLRRQGRRRRAGRDRRGTAAGRRSRGSRGGRRGSAASAAR